MMGMIGMFILHPPRAHAAIVDHDFGIVLQHHGPCWNAAKFRAA
jgi:hypothetical protein